MIDSMLGTKIGMTSSLDARGRRSGSTLILLEPNLVTQIKYKEGKDSYDGVQLGIGSKKSVKKPQIGHLKKAGIDKKIRWMREIKVNPEEIGTENLKPGQEIKIDQVFSVGDLVKVTGTSKGKGFQGGVRRHGFHGGPKTHGQSDRHRAPGSIGSGTTPGRVYRGKKMAGHMGAARVSTKGLEVVGVDKNKNLLIIKGAVPGFIGSLIILQKQGRVKGYTPPPEPEAEIASDESSSKEKNESPNVSTDNAEGGNEHAS